MTSLTRTLITTVCLVSCAFASAAVAQSRVYTNADLGRPLTPNRMPPAEAARLLAPYQFVGVPDHSQGAQILILGSSPTAGPFGEFQNLSLLPRSDGTYGAIPIWPTLWPTGRQRPHDFSRGVTVGHPRSEGARHVSGSTTTRRNPTR
jgi:hypothetical protein